MLRKIKMIEGAKSLSHQEQRSIKGGHCLTCADMPSWCYLITAPGGCATPPSNSGLCAGPYRPCAGAAA